MGELSLWGLALGEHCDANGEGVWGWIVYPGVMLYMFYLLAQICDGHLTLALEFIVDRMKLSEDVAGATFLAMASSAPELFCSIVSTFVLVSASGVGNIVGSALFNLLVIIGVTPVFAGTSLKIWWYPTARDSAFYAMAIIEIFFVMQDGKVYWYEALVMVVSYAGYVFYFTRNQAICRYLKLEPPFPAYSDGEEQPKDEEAPQGSGESGRRQAGTGETAEVEAMASADKGEIRQERRCRTAEELQHDAGKSQKGSGGFHDLRRSQSAGHLSPWRKDRSNSQNGFTLKGRRTKDLCLSKVLPEPTEEKPEAAAEAQPKEEAPQPREKAEEEQQAEQPEEERWCKWEPVMMVVDRTMPNRPERLYSLFALCCLWIGFFTYFAVDAADRLGCLLTMPDVVMGLVVLAAGTSVPDAMGSISVARDGMGDMAVANAVGSNTFDILLGLGLPWFLKGAITQEPILVPTDRLQEAIIQLACCLFCYLCMISLNKWTLTRNLGFCLLLLYVCLISWILVRSFVDF